MSPVSVYACSKTCLKIIQFKMHCQWRLWLSHIHTVHLHKSSNAARATTTAVTVPDIAPAPMPLLGVVSPSCAPAKSCWGLSPKVELIPW